VRHSPEKHQVIKTIRVVSLFVKPLQYHCSCSPVGSATFNNIVQDVPGVALAHEADFRARDTTVVSWQYSPTVKVGEMAAGENLLSRSIGWRNGDLKFVFPIDDEATMAYLKACHWPRGVACPRYSNPAV
jgi:hypothetical protein